MAGLKIVQHRAAFVPRRFSYNSIDMSQVPHTQPAVNTRAQSSPAARFVLLFRGRRLLLTLVVLLGAATMVGLGFWQLDRRDQKRERNALIRQRMAEPPLRITGPAGDPSLLAYRPAIVAGTFDYEHEVVLRTRTREGQAGVRLLTPLRISGTEHSVLVDRGWIPYEESEPEARSVYRPAGAVELSGLLHPSQTRPSSFAPADPPLGPGRERLDEWFRADIGRIQEQTPYPLLPFYVAQSAAPGENGPPWRDGQVTLSEGPHLSYAIQWFSFAVVLLAGYVARATRPVRP